MRPVIFTDERMLDHVNGPGHPESPDRLRAVHAMLRALPDGAIERRSALPATHAQIEAVHDPGYVARIKALRGRRVQLDPDTAVSEQSVDAAYLAAGCALAAAEAVIVGPARRAWALVRPPGHHAEPDEAMGFCLFDNIAVAAENARQVLGVERILIVDWDVHHGNGTQAIFEARRDVLFVSSHQYPLYPGTGAIDERGTGAGRGYTVNVPLPAGVGDEVVVGIYRALLPSLAERFRPELVLVSAGFDAHVRDPVGQMRMSDAGFASLCAVVCEVADAHADGRLALVLEGGYDIEALSAGVRSCIDVMAGRLVPSVSDGNDARIDRIIADVLAAHADAARG